MAASWCRRARRIWVGGVFGSEAATTRACSTAERMPTMPTTTYSYFVDLLGMAVWGHAHILLNNPDMAGHASRASVHRHPCSLHPRLKYSLPNSNSTGRCPPTINIPKRHEQESTIRAGPYPSGIVQQHMHEHSFRPLSSTKACKQKTLQALHKYSGPRAPE